MPGSRSWSEPRWLSLQKFRGGKDARKRGTRFAALRSLALWPWHLLDGGGWIEHYGWVTCAPCASAESCSASLGVTYRGSTRTVGARPRNFARVITAAAIVGSQHLAASVATRGSGWGHGHRGATLCLVVRTHVPSWKATIDADSGDDPARQVTTRDNSCSAMIECNVRGQLTPACSAEGFYDRAIFGQQRCAVWESADCLPRQAAGPPGLVLRECVRPRARSPQFLPSFPFGLVCISGTLAAQNTRAQTLTHWSWRRWFS